MATINSEIISHALTHYHRLHQNPELSFEEYDTSAYIRHIFKQLHIPFEVVNETGTIGMIYGKDSSRTIALRADIDALPIQESQNNPEASQNPGIMHACGHDMNTACLLGAAEYLKIHEAELTVNVMLIFQHAEEVLPGGAKDIIVSETFSANKPEWIIALHAEPDLQAGTFGLCPGQYMASGDEIYITLKGPGGHAALPDKTTDIVLAASHIIVALQQITSRHASPLTPTVLTFGNVHCNSTMNVIPREITLEGTFRTFDEDWRENAKKLIRKIASTTGEGMGAEIKVNIIEGYPSLYNDPHKTTIAQTILQNLFGNDRVITLDKRMTTEDFARYSHIVPATFIRMGVNGTNPCGKLHTPDFFPSTDAIGYGIKVLCTFVLSEKI